MQSHTDTDTHSHPRMHAHTQTSEFLAIARSCYYLLVSNKLSSKVGGPEHVCTCHA